MVKDISRQGSRKDMLETGRRSAISTSELGLYSERVDRLTRSRYSLVVRKFAVGVMVVVAVILVIVFLYDFSSATVNSKVNQETKHIYILQNALKKPTNFSRKFSQSSGTSEGNHSKPDLVPLQDRSDDENYDESLQVDETMHTSDNPESRAQNLRNYKLRKRILKSITSDMGEQAPEGKQLFDNHAVVYRVRQRHKYPDWEKSDSDESRPTPFHWEYRTPHPASFKRPRYPQLAQYRYPQNSKNIQDIIKYLTNDAELPSRGIKFAGVYVNPKKYDMIPELGEMMSNSDRSSEEIRHAFQVPINEDPFYQYKPKHPADVNLLATSNVRFSPTGLHRYNPFYEQVYARPVLNYNKQPLLEPQYDGAGSYMPPSVAMKRKPKPFSVMLDIYPITDLVDQNKKTTRPRPPQLVAEDFEARRPFQYSKGLKYFAPSAQPIAAVGVPSQQANMDEDERQQMVFHLNLYPRKKNRMSRHEILHKSANMGHEERVEFAEKIMTPLETIAKHLTDHSAIEEFKYEEEDTPKPTSMPITRYQETNLPDEEKKESDLSTESEKSLPHSEQLYADSGEIQNLREENATIPGNHKLIIDDDYASTEKYEAEGQKTVETTTEKEILEYTGTDITEEPKVDESTVTTFQIPKDIDTVEGFQRFNDGLIAMD